MKRCQVLVCKCGARYAACIEPECYTDKEWLKDLKKHVKEDRGTVEMIDRSSFYFTSCTCDKVNNNEPTLF